MRLPVFHNYFVNTMRKPIKSGLPTFTYWFLSSIQIAYYMPMTCKFFSPINDYHQGQLMLYHNSFLRLAHKNHGTTICHNSFLCSSTSFLPIHKARSTNFLYILRNDMSITEQISSSSSFFHRLQEDWSINNVDLHIEFEWSSSWLCTRWNIIELRSLILCGSVHPLLNA